MTDLASDRDVAVTIETTRGEVQLRWNPTVGGFEVGMKDSDRMSWVGPFPFVESLEAATALTLPKRAHDLLEHDREQEPGRVAARLVAPGAVDVGTPTGLMAYRDGRVERYRVESLGSYVGGFDERGVARISFDDGKRSVPVRHVVVHSVDGFAWGYDGAGPRDAGYAMLRHELSRTKPGAINLDDVTTANSRLFTTDVVRVLVPNEPFRLSADTVRTWALEHELVSQLRSPEQETAKLLRSKVAEAARTALDVSQSALPSAQGLEPPRPPRPPRSTREIPLPMRREEPVAAKVPVVVVPVSAEPTFVGQVYSPEGNVLFGWNPNEGFAIRLTRATEWQLHPAVTESTGPVREWADHGQPEGVRMVWPWLGSFSTTAALETAVGFALPTKLEDRLNKQRLTDPLRVVPSSVLDGTTVLSITPTNSSRVMYTDGTEPFVVALVPEQAAPHFELASETGYWEVTFDETEFIAQHLIEGGDFEVGYSSTNLVLVEEAMMTTLPAGARTELLVYASSVDPELGNDAGARVVQDNVLTTWSAPGHWVDNDGTIQTNDGTAVIHAGQRVLGLRELGTDSLRVPVVAAAVDRSTVTDFIGQRLRDDAPRFVEATPTILQPVVSQRVGVDATPLRDQLLMIGIQERSSPEVLAIGLNLEPLFVERVLSREQMLLDVGEVRAVCEGLHCDPDDLWPPVVVEEQILPQYPVQDWPPYKDRIEPPLGVKLAVSSVAWTAGIAMVQRVSGESLASVIPLVQLGTNQPQVVPLITDTVNVVEKEVTIDLRNERDATVNVDSQRGEQRGAEKGEPNVEANRLLDGVVQSREVGR